MIQVEEYAFKKWGGEEGLDAEYERREAQKKEKKDKRFKEKLAGKSTRDDVAQAIEIDLLQIYVGGQ